MNTKAVLREIQANDPDGRPNMPTDADYLAFRNWVINTYGREVWRQYIGGGWDNPEV